MKQRRPPESVTVRLRQVHLVGDHVGEGADSLGMAPSGAVVRAQARREADDLGRGKRRLGGDPAAAGLINATSEVAHVACSSGGGEALRRLARERHVQLEEHRKRECAPGHRGNPHVGEAADGQHCQPPHAETDERGRLGDAALYEIRDRE
jgi:hypothetical protein